MANEIVKLYFLLVFVFLAEWPAAASGEAVLICDVSNVSGIAQEDTVYKAKFSVPEVLCSPSAMSVKEQVLDFRILSETSNTSFRFGCSHGRAPPLTFA